MRLAFLPTLALVTLVGVRVLRVRLGWWRAILVGWLGLATAGLTLSQVREGGPPPVPWIIAAALVAMIAWAGVFELMSSSRSEPVRRGSANPFQALRDSLARGRRATDIGFIATRFGLNRFARRRSSEPQGAATGRALRSALQQAGGVYVKLGQFLSTRPDLVSHEIADELQDLQQNATPVPLPLIHRVMVDELGPDVDDLFAVFDPEPVAAASIAQVHRAELADGRRVAVKVQRPDVARGMHLDLDILLRLADRLERRTQWAFEIRLSNATEGFAENVLGELDFEAEARNLLAMADAVKRHPRFVVPRPVGDVSRTRVLVMDWIDGSPLTEAAPRLPEADRYELARALLRCLLDQILVVGTFHADPHPGNLYLTEDGRIGLIDCGAVGRLTPTQRAGLQTALAAIATQDAAALRDALRPMTTASRNIDEPLLERALSNVLVNHLGPSATPGSEFITALMELTREFGLALEPVVAGALRALASIQSTLELLAPDFDLLGETKAYGEDLVNPLWSPTHPRSPLEELEAQLPAMLPTLTTLPRRLLRIVEAAERNEIELGVNLFRSDRDRRFVDAVAAQVVGTMAAAAIGLIGGLLVIGAGSRLDTDTGRMLQAGGVGCVGVAVLALLSTLVTSIRQQRERR